MSVVVTGAGGFVGRNLVVALRRSGVDVAELEVSSTAAEIRQAVAGAAAVFHLAGVNRPEHEDEFITGNVGSLESVLAVVDDALQAGALSTPPLVLLSSSAQAAQANPYGRSKLAAEQVLEQWSARTGASAVIYRLPGVFGKWCRPNYNSVVATFCHNIARDLPITVSDPARVVELLHVDDVVTDMMGAAAASAPGVVRPAVAPVFTITLGDLADRIRAFREARQTLLVSDASDPLTRRLLGTYTSYLPLPDLAYPLLQRTDPRGTLAELLKSPAFGQMFVSRTFPGITRGNHYHDMKVEKFCVLEGDALIRFRSILGDEVVEHRVSGTEFRVVDIPPGVTHSITNVGSTEMIVLFWASEILDPARTDTYFLEV